MFEILFRGKRTDCNLWVYGCLVNKIIGAKYPAIIHTSEYTDNNQIDLDWDFVTPETIGQYTGLTDINNKKIFDGDIIKHYNEKINPHKFVLSIVKWDCSKSRFYKTDIEDCTNWAMSASCKYEVIGNIHDNPELLA